MNSHDDGSTSMDDSIDNNLNRMSGFRHPAIKSATETRLLQISRNSADHSWQYDLVVVALEDLSSTSYRALSYTWGKATSADDLQSIRVGNQQFFVRQNLFDFLASATAKEECGLFFVDAVCINQLDYDERQAQVQAMALVYSRATCVISWLGTLPQEYDEGCRALSQVSEVSCTRWSEREWKALKYLSYAPYWTRVWVVQEVLLASHLTIWCGPFTFSPTLLGRTPQVREAVYTKFGADGRPSVSRSDTSRLRCPSEAILAHRMRLVPRMKKDTTPEGCTIGTLEDMVSDLQKPSMSFEPYQSRVSDELHSIMRKFGRLQCTDIRDRLYGFIGLLDERSRKKLNPDYKRSVEYAFYQALKFGLEELCPGYGVSSWGLGDSWISYFCEARDAFNMGDEISVRIFRQVYRELDFKTRMEDVLFQEQWNINYGWRGADAVHYRAFAHMIIDDELDDDAFSDADRPLLLRFHNKQRHLFEKISMKIRRRPKASYSRLLT
ncbi:heterokaryon incompatibility domain-containing protein [Trichoderma camerunense]